MTLGASGGFVGRGSPHKQSVLVKRVGANGRVISGMDMLGQKSEGGLEDD